MRSFAVSLWFGAGLLPALAGPNTAAWAVPVHPALQKGSFALDLGSAARQGMDQPSPQAVLPRRALVILVDFADQPHASNITPETVREDFFGAEPSVRDFYDRSSYGRYAAAGEVTPWIRLPQTLAFYADGQAGVGGSYPRNARRMVEDAVRAADGLVDFSLYDNDGPDGLPSSGDDDGQVDALAVVHAGRGAEFGDANSILSHWWYTTATVATRDGPFAWSYITVSESSPLGVRAHEFGHLLGLPDLYDRRQGSRRAAGGLGEWSLMAAGAWLGGGDTPCDLDAPSKIDLGFLDAIAPSANASSLSLRNVTGEVPQVYKLWTHGRPGSEYLVIENRRRAGLDVAVPASGMLVYHVNHQRFGNDDPDDLQVQLLQADGLAQIENLQSNGDPGDPFPGTLLRQRLDADTVPSTRARDGSDSQIVISNISAPSANMSFALVVGSRPAFELAGHLLEELAGDGDGFPEAGERLQLVLQIANFGSTASDVQASCVATPADAAIWEIDRVPVGHLQQNDSTRVLFVLEPQVREALALDLVVRIDDPGTASSQELPLTLGLGAEAGFLACLEPVASRFSRDCADPAAPWVVENLRGNGTWRLEAAPGEYGKRYRSAAGATYAGASDVALVSPPFNLRPRSRLSVLHAYDIEDFQAGWAWDGARVEISLDGSNWEALQPRAGYPRRMFPESISYLAEAGVFAGRQERRWDIFELDARRGSARLRFRLASNDSIERGGWELYRVEVDDAVEPDLAVPLLELLPEPNPVRFPARLAFRVLAPREQPARLTRLSLFDVRGRLVRQLEHASVPAQAAMFSWDGTDHAGQRVAAGIYWARLEWGSLTTTRKFTVVD